MMNNIPQEVIDRHLQSVLRASGSELRHYEMPSVLHNMRNAMRIAIEEGVRIGRLDAEKSDAPIGKD